MKRNSFLVFFHRLETADVQNSRLFCGYLPAIFLFVFLDLPVSVLTVLEIISCFFSEEKNSHSLGRLRLSG